MKIKKQQQKRGHLYSTTAIIIIRKWSLPSKVDMQAEIWATTRKAIDKSMNNHTGKMCSGRGDFVRDLEANMPLQIGRTCSYRILGQQQEGCAY